MWTLERYTEWIMERLSALGALPEDIENVVRSAQQEVLTRLSQRTGIPFNRGMQLSLFDPAMLHQEIEVHKRTRIRELMQIVTVPQVDRSTPNSFTRAVESLIPEADFGSGRIFEIPELVRSAFGLNIQVDERSILSAFINGFRTGLIRSLGTIHEPSITDAFNQRELNGLGIAIGVIWGASDEIIDTVDSAARFSRNVWEVITEGIPPEVIQAIRIISERLSQGISDRELIDLAAQAGDQTGESAASDFVNNITLVYRMSPSDPLLSNVWPSIVTGRLIMPLVRTLLELVLAWTPAGGGLLIIRIAARIMRYMPDISGPLQRLAHWLRSIGRLRRRAGSHHGSSHSSSSGPPSPDPATAGSGHHGTTTSGTDTHGTVHRDRASPDSRSPQLSSPADDPPAPVVGSGPPAQMVRGRGWRPFRMLTGRTARTGGIRTVAGSELRDHRIEFEIQGKILPGLRREDAMGFESHGFRSPGDITIGDVSLSNYERAHLWGPGWFGDEAYDGIMYAPSELNQRWQSIGIERRIQQLRELVHLEGGEVHVTARARSFPRARTPGLRGRELVLQEVEYEVSVLIPDRSTEPRRVFHVMIEVDHPLDGGTVHTPDLDIGPAWHWFF